MSAAPQSFDHELNPIAGWPNPYALVKSGIQLASTTVNTVTARAGMVGSLYPTAGADQGKLALGVLPPTTGVAPMPMFLFQNENDYDAVGDDGNLVGAPSSGTTWRAKINCLVASGSFELESTEYVSTGMVTGAMIVAGVSANLGKLQSYSNAAPGTNPSTIVGVVSDGVITSDQPGGPSRVRFWCCYVPHF